MSSAGPVHSAPDERPTPGFALHLGEITASPWAGGGTRTIAVIRPSTSRQPTHLLHGGRAQTVPVTIDEFKDGEVAAHARDSAPAYGWATS